MMSETAGSVLLKLPPGMKIYGSGANPWLGHPEHMIRVEEAHRWSLGGYPQPMWRVISQPDGSDRVVPLRPYDDGKLTWLRVKNAWAVLRAKAVAVDWPQ